MAIVFDSEIFSRFLDHDDVIDNSDRRGAFDIVCPFQVSNGIAIGIVLAARRRAGREGFSDIVWNEKRDAAWIRCAAAVSIVALRSTTVVM